MKPRARESIYNIKPYVAGKSKAAGVERIIKLSSNENSHGPSPKAVEAYAKAAEKLFRYPDSSYVDLRKAIAASHGGIDENRIICGAGSDELIGLLVNAYTSAGDEVIYSEHGFLMYKIYTQVAGAEPVAVPEKNLKFDVDAVLARVSPKTKIVFIANPNNPTGSYISRSELERLYKGLPGHVILAIDAAYTEYVTAADYTSGMEMVDKAENVVVLRTFSKVYGLSALRLGWGYFPAEIADVLNRARGPFNVSTPAIMAGIAAVEDQGYVKKCVKLNGEGLELLSSGLSGMGLKVYPSVCNFLLVDFPDGAKNSVAANEFLTSRGIIVREVVNYGLPEALRITVGTEEENQLLLRALTEFMQR